MISRRARHIPRGYFKVRELIQNQEIKIQYIKSALNPADCLTKPLGPELNQLHRSFLIARRG